MTNLRLYKGVMSDQEFMDKVELWTTPNQLPVYWYKAGPEGARYDVVTDKSDISDSISRAVKHIKDAL